MANKALNLGNANNLLDITVNQNLTIGSGGNLTLAQDPTSALQAATKQYVDGKTGAATTSAAGVMSAADKAKLDSINIAYATCTTAAATAAKVATITGNTNWTLAAGSIVCAKSDPVLTTSPTKVTVTPGSTTTFNITYTGDGTLSVASSNTAIATVSLSGTTATVKGVATGTCNITVSAS